MEEEFDRRRDKDEKKLRGWMEKNAKVSNFLGRNLRIIKGKKILIASSSVKSRQGRSYFWSWPECFQMSFIQE